jgi:hypothetical protein
MPLITHPLIARVIEAGRAFRDEDVSATQLQAVVSSVMSAVEGDVPLEVRDALFRLEAEIDSAQFTVGESQRLAAIVESLDAFDALVDSQP